MDYSVQSIEFAVLDQTEHLFKISSNSDYSDLIASIDRLGLLNYPFVLKKNEVYIVVSGFRRIAACHQLEWQGIPARVIQPETSLLDVACLAIADNALQRDFNLTETYRAIGLLYRITGDEAATLALAPSLGLPANRGYILDLLAVQKLPTPVIQGVLSGSIGLSVALKLSTFGAEAATAAADLLNSLQVGINIQRELLALIEEISLREATGIEALLADNSYRDLLADQDIERRQKAKALRQKLKQRRFPAITEKEQHFAQLKQKHILGPNIQIHAPAFFEGTRYSLRCDFTNKKDLLDLQSKLTRIISDKDFDAFWAN